MRKYIHYLLTPVSCERCQSGKRRIVITLSLSPNGPRGGKRTITIRKTDSATRRRALGTQKTNWFAFKKFWASVLRTPFNGSLSSSIELGGVNVENSTIENLLDPFSISESCIHPFLFRTAQFFNKKRWFCWEINKIEKHICVSYRIQFSFIYL